MYFRLNGHFHRKVVKKLEVTEAFSLSKLFDGSKYKHAIREGLAPPTLFKETHTEDCWL